MKLSLALLLALAVAHSGVAQIVSRGDGRARTVALTFDAGADRGYALRILRTLERNHVKATFGMTGAWAVANRDLLRRMVHGGDALINHTYDHRSFTGLSTRTGPLSTRQRSWEIMHTERVIHDLVGRSTRPYFRPPYGDYDPATRALLGRLGYRYMVMWTVDSGGAAFLPAGAILQRCLAGVVPGAIVLMHVGIQSQDAFALQPLITDLKRRGYAFVTVPALLSRR